MKGLLRSWRNYSRTLFRSVSDLRFFREARRRRPHQAVGYVAVLIILFWVLPFSIVFFGGVRQGLDAVIGGLRDHVPAGTEFRMEEGRLSNTLQEPIVVREDGFTFIVNTATSTEALGEDEIGVVVNADAVVQKEARDRTQTIGYSEVPDFSVTREGIDEWIDRYAVWVVLLASVVAVPFFFVAVGVGYSVYLLFHAFVLWLLLRAFRAPHRYGEAFTVAAYAATMPVILKAVFSWSGAEIGSAATWVYWALLAFIVYDFSKEAKKEAPSHGEKKTQNERSGGRGARPDDARGA